MQEHVDGGDDEAGTQKGGGDDEANPKQSGEGKAGGTKLVAAESWNSIHG